MGSNLLLLRIHAGMALFQPILVVSGTAFQLLFIRQPLPPTTTKSFMYIFLFFVLGYPSRAKMTDRHTLSVSLYHSLSLSLCIPPNFVGRSRRGQSVTTPACEVTVHLKSVISVSKVPQVSVCKVSRYRRFAQGRCHLFFIFWQVYSIKLLALSHTSLEGNGELQATSEAGHKLKTSFRGSFVKSEVICTFEALVLLFVW